MRPLAVAGLLVALAGGGKKAPAAPGANTPGASDPGASEPAKAAASERDQLLTALKTKRGEAQRRAADRLADLAVDDPKAVDALVELLRDRANAGPGKSTPAGIASVREAAAVALLRAGPPGEAALKERGLAPLREGLADKDPAVREHSAHTLGLLGPLARPAAGSVQRLLSDPDPRVREVAYEAVAAIGTTDVPALAALLNSSDKEIARRAAEAVALLTEAPADAAGSFARALQSDDEAVRLAGGNGLAVAPPANPTRQTAEGLVAAIKKAYPEQADPQFNRIDGPEAVYWRALAKCGKVAVSPTADLLAHTNAVVRMLAARTLPELGPDAKDAVPALDKALNDPFANVALEVACTLTRLGEKGENVAALVKAALASPERRVAAAAVEAVGRMGPAGRSLVPLAVAQLNSPLPESRYAAVWLVGRMPPTEAVAYLPALAKLLPDPEAEVRGKVAAVLEALGPAASPVAETVGKQVAAEPDELVRDQFVDALREMGPGAKPAVPGLLPLVTDAKASASLRAKAVAAVVGADPGSPQVAAAVTQAAADADLSIRLASAAALGRLDPLPDDAQTALAKMARSDAKVEARAAAVRGLAAAGPRAKAARPDLEAVAAGTLPGLDLWAKVALASVDGDIGKAAPAVRAGLADKSATVRAAAAEALALVGPTEADIPALAKLLRDQSASAREAAAEALGRIGPAAKATVPRLVVLLAAREGEVRAAAAEALGRIGPAARPAIPKLKEAAKDPATAAAARKAIERINHQPGEPDSRK